MRIQKHPFRLVLFVFVMLCLLTGLTGISRVPEQVEAAPQQQAIVYPPYVVISEFRARGPASADDEFIEIFNASNSPVDITGWKLRKSSGCGSTLTDLVTINAFSLSPGQHYLVGKAPDYTGSTDQTYASNIADDGGIALVNGAGTIIDRAGMCSTTTYKEGTALAAITSATTNLSYERKAAGEIRNCTDTDNNAGDFVLNASTSNPQTSSSPFVPCLYVTNVNSTYPDGLINTANVDVNITVEFSSPVFVSGTPTLQLETGVTNRPANYVSGSGSSTLTFRYTTVDGDFTNDLDYTSSTALSGAIYDTIGNAILTLPTPGAVNSLGANRAIQINVDNGIPPALLSFRRQTPATSPTNANSLTFRATFNENVINVDATDFVVHPNATGANTTAVVSGVTGSGNVYDVTVSGGDLAGFDGTVGLDLAGGSDIQDQTGNTVTLPEGLSAANDETFVVDNTSPGVTVTQASGQADPTGVTPINFTVVFSESIVASTFTTADITQPTFPTFVTWTITPVGTDSRTFTLAANNITRTSLLLQPSINAGLVTDVAGNTNTDSTLTPTDNSVQFTDTTAPTVTINQATGQADPTTALPVRFTVVFSEPINVSTFTPSDLTLSGTATVTAWTIVPATTGNLRTFTVSATVVSVGGTIIPSITANRVTDVAGNGNAASTSTDNSVRYGPPPTPTITRTRTPTPVRTATRTRTPTLVPTIAPPQLVAINEFVPRPGHDWNNDGAVNVQDEFIEIINHGNVSVNLSGYSLDDEANIGSNPYRLPSVIIQPGERLVFYGSETGLLLSDGGDGVRLLKPNGQLMDAYNYTVARYADQSYCRLPDDGGLDDWNQNCYPTPGLQNSLNPGIVSPTTGNGVPLCPIADTLPEDFVFAECDPFGNNIWRPEFWDETGWLGEQVLPGFDRRWDVIAD